MENIIMGKESIICEDTNCYILEYCMLVHKANKKADEKNTGACTVYGLEIRKMINDTLLESAVIEKFTSDEDRASNMISLLRKHVVTPVSFYEVIQDLQVS